MSVTKEDLDDAFEDVELYDHTTDNHVVHLLDLLVQAVKELMQDG